MNLPINEQTVLITGAGRGLGSSISKSFHREGAKVIINYRKSYDSAKRLKYKLMSKTLWHELTLGDVSSLMTYCGVYTHEVTSSDIMYGGSKFLTNEK